MPLRPAVLRPNGSWRFQAIPAEERFWPNVKFMPSGCWEWQGHRNRAGYGVIYLNGIGRAAHRWVYERTWGELPQWPKAVVLHTCDNPPCVRVAHLRAGTVRDNHLDMIAKGRQPRNQYVGRTHCKHGHEYTPENTRIEPRRKRVCRRCELLATWKRRGKNVNER